VLQGRERERGQIGELLDAAATGSGGALVVTGDPGAGKSALLDEIAREARDQRGMTVLRTQGVESEAPLPFAALQRLLLPLLPLADQLPAPQAHALRVALGQEAGEGTDRFLVFLATLSLLAEAAGTRPVLAVVDDAHWLDDASAAAGLFAARRVQVEHIAILFASRADDVRAFDSGDLRTLELGGLDLSAATELLSSQAGVPVSREVGAQLLASTGGNPLALMELPRVLGPEQLTGTASLPARLPVTEAVERAFLDRSRRLSGAAQRLLLVAAADDSGSVAVVNAAAAALDVGPEALAEAESSGLVRVQDRILQMRHPLVRSAVYAAATSMERRAVHAALAEVLTHSEDADRRAWHLAASVDAPDESVVTALDEAAVRAEQRGGHEAASAAWERAAELSDDANARARRLYGAARGAWLAGQPSRSVPMADAAAAAATEPALRADVIRLRARMEWNTGSGQLGHRMLLEAVTEVASHDRDRAREMAMFAAAIAAFGADSGIDVDPRDYAGLPASPSPRQRCFSELLLGLAEVRAGKWPEAHRILHEAFATGEELHIDDQDLLPNLGIAAMHLGDTDAMVRYHERLLARARNTGAVVMVLYSLTRLGVSDVATGQWAALTAHETEALQIAEGTGQPGLLGLPQGFLMLLAALRGDDEFDVRAARVAEILQTQRVGIVAVVLRDVDRWARGLWASPRTPAGFHHLAQIGHHVVKLQASIDRIESAVHADQHETAEVWINDVERFAEATEQAWAGAAAAHGRAVLAAARGEDAQPDFDTSLKLHARSPRIFDRARTELAYGEYLRRTRRRVAAREHLRAALQTFEDLRATPWVERAGRELRASGESTRRRDETAPVELTPTELQVAQLVQQGLSNREVAAQLFVSPRTVDFHLRNVYTKAGVSSRTELTTVNLG
jgi:DNA-binding CsgD family transcriptional regulator